MKRTRPQREPSTLDTIKVNNIVLFKSIQAGKEGTGRADRRNGDEWPRDGVIDTKKPVTRSFGLVVYERGLKQLNFKFK